MIKAEDWENACHELLWEKGQTDLFTQIQTRARELAEQPAAAQPSASSWKPTKLENPDFQCLFCASYEVEYREIESSDHDDIKYRCRSCDRSWISEGPDA